jgi:hypothetical protein
VTGPFLYLLFHYRKLDTLDLFFEYYMISLISIVTIFIFLSWLARVIENLVINTIKKEQLEKQAVEAELYYLKSQINPHFLFNTLNKHPHPGIQTGSGRPPRPSCSWLLSCAT